MDNIRAIFMVIFAMAAFTIEDAFVKTLSTGLALGQILLLIGVGGALIFAALTWRRGHHLTMSKAWGPLPLARAAAEAVSVVTFTTALSLIDISVVAAVFQATPLAITMGAALFLGEAVGWRRWSAIFIGFIGVLIIIRPGLEGFQPMAMIVLITVLSIAARDLITRRIDSTIPSSIVAFQGFAITAVCGIILLALRDGMPVAMSAQQSLMMLCAVICGASGYYGIVHAMRIADASAVMPFRYTRLIFSIIVGVIVFNERPDLLTLFGAALIMATGLYTFIRERQLALSTAKSDC